MINLDTYCSHAFGSYDNRMRSVCCRAMNHGPVINYNHTFVHPEIQQLRRDLVNGIKNPICQTCWQDERAGLESTRQKSIENKPLWQIEQEVHDPKLRWIWIDTGNHCNLACRTCYPGFSTNLGAEWSKKFNNKDIMMVKSPDLSPMVQDDLTGINTVMILGGEPFLNLNHLDVLRAVVAQGSSRSCKVIYVTNNSKRMPEPIIDQIKNFQTLRVILSVDAIGEKFNYIRTRGRWGDFEDNFYFLKELIRVYPNLTIGFNITVSALNCLYLNELYQWIDQNHRLNDVTVGFVNGADHYSFKIFSQHQKQQLISQLQLSEYDFSHVIEMIQQNTSDPPSLDAFWKDVAWTESFHGMHVNDYLPELVELLKSG